VNSTRETIVLSVDPAEPDPAALVRAAAVLRRGDLVAFPTETVYGLGANALDAAAVAKIFVAKGRPAADPLIVHLAIPAQLGDVARQIPPLAHELAAAFWPGPLTLVLRRQPAVPTNVTAGRDTVAVRVPAHPVALALLAAAGVPIAAPSANLFTYPSPTQAAHVLEDLGGRIDMILDGGPTTIGIESTVLDLTQEPPALLRPGGVPLEALRHYLPGLDFSPSYVELENDQRGQAAPGMLLKHYSPRAKLQLYAGEADRALARMHAEAAEARASGAKVGVMVPEGEATPFATLGVEIATLGPAGDLAQVGRRIFAAMRDLDQRGVEVILARAPDRAGLGLAIWDRLVRAAEGHVIDVGHE
jgi:L-threonylcarbamoyladenylate synthase